jgi:prepilin peptidase CpaA
LTFAAWPFGAPFVTFEVLVLWSILGLALVISVATDLTTRRILDAVTFPAIGLALAFRFWRQGLGSLEVGFISGAVAAAGAAALFASVAVFGKGFGWGDVKLMAAVGAAFGYPDAVDALVLISLVGAVQAVLSLLWQGALWDTLSAAVRRLAVRLMLLKDKGESPRRHIPYGVAIALGSFWAMWWEQSKM